MLLSLVDSLRCPAEHEETALVLSVESWEGSRVSSGVLGCPRCHARYPIRDGVADFAEGIERVQLPVEDQSGESGAIRLAAQLGLSEPGGIVLLTGRYASLAEGLLGLVDVTCLLFDSRATVPMEAVRFRLRDRVPLMSGVLRAAAVDEPGSGSTFLTEACRCIRGGGRVVAPKDSTIPLGIRVVANDDREWVGEVDATVPVVLRRRESVRE